MAREYKQKVGRSYPSDLGVDYIYEELQSNKLPDWHRFKGVNVWRTSFGPIASLAVFDLYSQRFNVSLKEARREKFTHCVDALRQLEDPNYIPHSERV